MATLQARQHVVIPSLDDAAQGRSLWSDALHRLFQNRIAVIGGVIIVILTLMAIFAQTLAPQDYDQAILSDSNAAPSWITNAFPIMLPKASGGYVTIREGYILGADKLGRDLWSRMIYGSRISLAVAYIGSLISVLVGFTVGIISGYAGGKVDNILMRFVDVMYAFPTLLLIILLMAFFRTGTAPSQPGTLAYSLNQVDSAMGGLLFIFVGIGLTAWMDMARLVRGQVLSVREKEYIEAARAIGARSSAIVFRHILPNIIGPLIVAQTLAIPSYISYESFLSFIGLGIKPPTPSWGSMIAEGAATIQTYPNQALFPAVMLFLTMFAFNFLGDGLRDALDPRMRGVN